MKMLFKKDGSNLSVGSEFCCQMTVTNRLLSVKEIPSHKKCISFVNVTSKSKEDNW